MLLLELRQKDSEPGLDRGTSSYLLIPLQTKGGLFLIIQGSAHLVTLKIERIAQIPK